MFSYLGDGILFTSREAIYGANIAGLSFCNFQIRSKMYHVFMANMQIPVLTDRARNHT